MAVETVGRDPDFKTPKQSHMQVLRSKLGLGFYDEMRKDNKTDEEIAEEIDIPFPYLLLVLNQSEEDYKSRCKDVKRDKQEGVKRMSVDELVDHMSRIVGISAFSPQDLMTLVTRLREELLRDIEPGLLEIFNSQYKNGDGPRPCQTFRVHSSMLCPAVQNDECGARSDDSESRRLFIR